jgi:D-mannonate dehydratase
MKLALTLSCWNDEDLMFARQFGADGILAQAVLPIGAAWDARILAAMRNRAEKAGLEFMGLADLPQPPGAAGVSSPARAEDDIGAACRFIEMAGEARIPVLSYAPASGDVASFLQRAVPAAERAGVKLACRLDETTAPAGDGAMGELKAAERWLDAFPSPCNGLDHCQELFAGAVGGDPPAAIQRIDMRRVFLVRMSFRQIPSSQPSSPEAVSERVPEDGSALRILQAYRAAGFDGPILPADLPAIAGDTGWCHQGHAYHIGYLRALLQVVHRPV